MDQTILAVRAISSEYAKRLLWLPLIIGVIVYVLLMGGIGWIATAVSGWWWLLGIIPTVVFLIALALWIVARLATNRISPPMNKAQKQSARQFIGRIDKVAEHAGMPKFVLIYRIVKDVIVRPTSSKTFIGELAQEPGEMRRAFDELRGLF